MDRITGQIPGLESWSYADVLLVSRIGNVSGEIIEVQRDHCI